MDKEQPEQSTPAEAVLDELRADAEMMKVHADNIVKAVDAISVTTNYGEGSWIIQVHVNCENFEKIFMHTGLDIVLTERRDAAYYPFERSVVIEEIKFFSLLEPKDLTREESAKWITDALKARGASKEPAKEAGIGEDTIREEK